MRCAPTHTHHGGHEGHEGHEALKGKVIGRLTGRPAKRASDAERGQAHTPKASQERCVCPASLYVRRLRRPVERPFVIFVAKPVVIFVVPKAA
jgi:hypothetical protein